MDDRRREELKISFVSKEIFVVTRQEREAELLALLQHRRGSLATLYREATGLTVDASIPASTPPAVMIMEILDQEFPGFVDSIHDDPNRLPPLKRSAD